MALGLDAGSKAKISGSDWMIGICACADKGVVANPTAARSTCPKGHIGRPISLVRSTPLDTTAAQRPAVATKTPAERSCGALRSVP